MHRALTQQHRTARLSSAKPHYVRAALLMAAVSAVVLPVARPCCDLAAAQSSQPSTRDAAVTIDARIHESLLRAGNVNALAEELKAADPNDSISQRQFVVVSMEQGDLTVAILALKRVLQDRPGDVELLAQLSNLQELTGAPTDAAATLKQVIELTQNASDRGRLQLRLALLQFDAGNPSDANALLGDAVKTDPALATPAGVIAYLNGQFEAAESFLGQGGSAASTALNLLRGNAALQAGRLADATTSFDAALRSATHTSDKRYAEERLIAAARRDGRLPQLADQWLADPNVSPERAFALASVLRELGRTTDLLAWWRKSAASPNMAAVASLPRVTNEVIGAAREAELTSDAATIARDVLARDPDDLESLTVVVRLMLDEQKVTDADKLLKAQITAAVHRPQRLEQIARIARTFGRDSMAIDAAQSLQSSGGDGVVDGLLIESSVLLNGGERALGNTILDKAAAVSAGNTDYLGRVAAAMEAADRVGEAIRLLQASVTLHADDEVMQRLAELLIEQNRPADAKIIFQTMRRTASSAALRNQASQRLLEVAAADKSLPVLTAALRKSVDSGTADEADMLLLVDVYTRTGHVEDAAEILKNAKNIDRKTRLSRMAVMYMRANVPDKAAGVLRELVDADPDNAIGTLEQLASIELDRKHSAAAADAIAEITRRAGSQSAAPSELLAGIFDRLGHPGEAAGYYRKALALNPDNTDPWLLWAAAASKSGHVKQAVQRLQVLADQAANENTFGLAVDGLLNLKATAPALQAARREAQLRLALNPGKIILYHIIVDLSDELKDQEFSARTIDASLAMSADERPQMLRDQMEVAMRDGNVEAASAGGRSILALGDDFPPQLFLQLGEQLLVNKRQAEASRAFARAIDVSSEESTAPKAADLFEQYGYPAQALAAVLPLQSRERNDLAITFRVARLYELLGQSDKAFDRFSASVSLCARKLSIEEEKNYGVSGVMPSEVPITLQSAVSGAIATARTLPQQNALLDQLKALADGFIHAGSATPPNGLQQVAAAIRFTGSALNRMDMADALDQKMASIWPADESIKQNAIASRLKTGMFSSAVALANKEGVFDRLPLIVRLSSTDSEASGLPATAPAQIHPDTAAAILPMLIARGKMAEAGQILDALPATIHPTSDEAMTRFIVAASVLGKDDLAGKLAVQWFDETARPQRTGVISRVWRILPESARDRLLQRVIDSVEDVSKNPGAVGMATLALELAASTGHDLPNRLNLALALAREPRSIGNLLLQNSAGPASLIQLLPPAERPTFVRVAIDQTFPAGRLIFLQRLLTQSIEPFDPATVAAIIKAAAALPDGQLIQESNWFSNPAHAALLPAIAEATLRAAAGQAGNDGGLEATLSSAAALRASNPDRADELAAGVIRQLRVPAIDAYDASASQARLRPRGGPPANGQSQARLFLMAMAILSHDVRVRIATSCEADPNLAATDLKRRAWALLMESIALDSVGRRSESLPVLRAAFSDDPVKIAIKQAFLDRLNEDGRSAEMVDTFAIRDVIYDPAQHVRVATAQRQLYRASEVHPEQPGVGVSSVIEPPMLDLMTPLAAGDQKNLAQKLRDLLQRQRNDFGAIQPIYHADAGGLLGEAPDATFNDVIYWPGSIADLRANFAIAVPGSTAARWIASQLADVAGSPRGHDVRDALVKALLDKASAGALGSNDRMLIEALAVKPGVSIPPALLAQLWTRALQERTEADLSSLLRCIRAQNGSNIVDLERWVNCWSQLGLSKTAYLGEGDQRTPLPSPIDFLNDGSVADWLSRLLNAGQLDLAEKEMLAIRTGGRLSIHDMQCGLVWARFAAERGDVSGYRDRLVAAIGANTWQSGPDPEKIDLSHCLPDSVQDSHHAAVLALATRDAVLTVAAQWPGDTNLTRTLASLSIWATTQNADDAAKSIFESALKLGDQQGPGEQQLWVADVARRIGRPDVATQIERSLLTAHCLPPSRIVGVLKQLAANGDAALAKKLAMDAARYCHEPKLLEFARDGF